MKLGKVKYERKNEALQHVVDVLFKVAKENKINFWKRVAEDLLKPARKRIAVNTSKIEQVANDNDNVVVCGKVLGYGTLTKKVTVVAYQFSDSAVKSIESAGGSVMSIQDFVKKNPKATGVRIIE
ncbi:50S ribosomal protein L18e [Candidatus Woesearchaeota archaeon]|nr:50S ribosomal protein L18e [Candidatus Woesearchaeota archaeon]